MHPPPYPYSDWDQRPPPHRDANLERGSYLWEAYGRFLDRCASGYFESPSQEGDGGWADIRIQSAGVSYGEYQHDAGAYDGAFGYYTEEECEAHRLREERKLSRAPAVNAKAQAANKKRAEEKARSLVLREAIIKYLRKTEKPAMMREIVAGAGAITHREKNAVRQGIYHLCAVGALRVEGERRGKGGRSKDDAAYQRYSLTETDLLNPKPTP